MKRTSKFIASTALLALTSLMSTIGCNSNNPADPVDDRQDENVSQSVQNVNGNSIGIFKNVASFKQVSSLIQGESAIVDLEVPEVENPESALSFARSTQQSALAKLHIDASVLYKSSSAFADSVIWDVTYEEEETGIMRRVSLIYDFGEDRGRLFFVGLQFPESHPLSYDSTEIEVSLNSTLEDDSDDVLLSLYNLKRYASGQLIDQEVGRFVPDPYAPGAEPTGGMLYSEVTYGSSSFIRNTSTMFEYHEGQGGRYSKDSSFSDNTISREAATFNEDGTGTFSQDRRDGTSIEGTFDSAEEDGVGSYSLTTNFPAGHDPISVAESGSFTIDWADSTINGSFSRETTFQNNRQERESVTVDQTVVGEVKTTTLAVQNSDGSSGLITITESNDVDQVAGEVTNADGTFAVFSAQQYNDGSAHLSIDLYASRAAFDAGQDPIVSGEFDWYPDGSGHGTVTEGNKTYEITINPDGSQSVDEVAS
ncbi:hypothetical protein MJD09_05720 [bacterium]|nr:hypothetical protein [bacterium]